MGIFFLLDVSSQLFNKLMIITSYNMIKMGGVIQGEITRLVLRISGVIPYFYLLYIFAWYMYINMTPGVSKI